MTPTVFESKNAIPWEKLFELEFIFEKNCWTTCNSYCCTHKNENLQFAFMRGGVGMVFMEEEFEFLKSQNQLQEGFLERSEFSGFSLGDGLDLKFYQSKCSLGGVCTVPKFRPLLCKLYPYFPKFNIATREVEYFYSASLIDQMFEATETAHPCTLVREKGPELRKSLETTVRPLGDYPYFIFYFGAVDILYRHVRRKTQELRDQHPDLPFPEFSSRWEFALLRGQLFDKEELRTEIKDYHRQVLAHYPTLQI